MSESSRRIHAASRQATTALKGYNEDDIRWTETRTIALMLTGVAFTDAVMQASRECTQRIFDRESVWLMALEAERQRNHAEAGAKREAEQTERRSRLEAQATLGQRPTLKTSLGDLLAARVRK